MFGSNLLQSIVGGLAAVAVSFLGGMWYGNAYGSNAWKLASIQHELDLTNGKLTALQEQDAEIAKREAEAEAKVELEFSAVAPTLKKCVLGKAEVEALNKVGG